MRTVALKVIFCALSAGLHMLFPCLWMVWCVALDMMMRVLVEWWRHAFSQQNILPCRRDAF